MREHLEEYWILYLAALGLVAMAFTAVDTVRTERAREAYCYQRGAVLVSTDAGRYCAVLDALLPVGEVS